MKNSRTLNRKRKFSEEFKKHLVREFESKKFSVLELSKLHNIHVSLLYKWVHKYCSIPSPNSVIVEMKDSSTKKLKAYQERIKELERIVGQKQIKLDYLDKIIALANAHYETDLKKTLGTKRFNGSKTKVVVESIL